NGNDENIRASLAEARAAYDAVPESRKAAIAEEIALYREMLPSDGEVYGSGAIPLGPTPFPNDAEFSRGLDLSPANYDPEREAEAKKEAAAKRAAYDTNEFLDQEILTAGDAFRMTATSHPIGKIAYVIADEFDGKTVVYHDENGNVKGTSRQEPFSG